jgi:hypothetical protein
MPQSQGGEEACEEGEEEKVSVGGVQPQRFFRSLGDRSHPLASGTSRSGLPRDLTRCARAKPSGDRSTEASTWRAVRWMRDVGVGAAWRGRVLGEGGAGWVGAGRVRA